MFITKHEPHEIVTILQVQVDRIPTCSDGFMKIWGTSPLCGIINEHGFELRNRQYHMFSLIAYGEFLPNKEGTKIKISFRKPRFPNIFWGIIFNRYKVDQKKIINFLKEWLKIKEVAEPSIEEGPGKPCHL